MTSELDPMARLVAYHDHIAMPPAVVADDVRRGKRRVRRHRGLLTAGVALGVAAVVGTASLVSGDTTIDRPQPAGPARTEASPSPPTTGWTGPLRMKAPMPVVDPEKVVRPPGVDGDPGEFVWTDARDAAVGLVDIQELRLVDHNGNGWLDWTLVLRAPHPRTSTLDPAQRVIEYGLVADVDGDRIVDCQIGINNDTPERGGYRVRVENLTIGVTDERVGPPYGVPIEFAHPGEAYTLTPGDSQELLQARTMKFWFLGGSRCGRFSESANIYAWASVTEQGRVTAWDYAPDAAWLAMREG